MQIAACHSLSKVVVAAKKTFWTTTLVFAFVYLHGSCDALQKQSPRLKSGVVGYRKH
jgi:hypothetical protein